MKATLRYLLMVVAMVSVLGANAQGTAQLPESKMQSTSGMVYSGSSLPQAAATGVVITTDDETNSSTAGQKGHIRKGRPGDWTDPYKDPIGDAVWPLMLLAIAFSIWIAKTKPLR
jgi:hypothetical protein